MLTLRSTKIVPLAIAAAVGFSAAPAHALEPSRWIAALPFGVGQFQNGDAVLGTFFATGEAVLGVTSIVTGALAMHWASVDVQQRDPETHRPVDVAALNEQLRGATTVNRVTFAGWAVLTAVGIVEAQVSFEPRRAAPERRMAPSITATAAPIPGGGLVGVRAVF